MIRTGTLRQLKKSKKEIPDTKIAFPCAPAEDFPFIGYRLSDGYYIQTSRVVSVRARRPRVLEFTTKSGSLYLLEEGE